MKPPCTYEQARTAGETWMVFKEVSPDGYHDEYGNPVSYPSVRPWGLLVNPADFSETIALTTDDNDGYTLCDGQHFELDTYIWNVADMCMGEEDK